MTVPPPRPRRRKPLDAGPFAPEIGDRLVEPRPQIHGRPRARQQSQLRRTAHVLLTCVLSER
jgi:hypothetical protein